MLALASLLQELRGRLECLYMSGIRVETLFVYLFYRKKNQSTWLVLGVPCVLIKSFICMETCQCVCVCI